MTKWTAAQLPDMTARTVVVTGASAGIGLITARELARVGARVVLAVRNRSKGEEIAKAIPGKVEVRQLDVADLASVRQFADEWTGEIDILINNAGVMQEAFSRTSDGFELQMATNYFGPFVLTSLLLPQVTDRVIMVSSQLHRMGHAHLDDLNGEKRSYNYLNAYCDSKLDILLFSLELQRRLTVANSSVRSFVAHPGIASTALSREVGGITGLIGSMKFLQNDPARGALPTLFAASQDIPGNSYVGPDGIASIKGYPKVRKPSRAARDTEVARKLWDISVHLTGVGPSIVI